MTLHIANKAGGGTLGTEIFFNVKYSTSEDEKNWPTMHKKYWPQKIFNFVEKARYTIHAEIHSGGTMHILVNNV